MKTKQEKDSRVYLHEGGLVIEYRRRAINFFNEYFQRDYRSEEFWIVRFAFEPKWFNWEDFRYDGCRWKTLTLCGLAVTKSYVIHSFERFDQT